MLDDHDEIAVPNPHSLTLLRDEPNDQFDILLNNRAEIGHQIKSLTIESYSLLDQEPLLEFAGYIRNIHYDSASCKILLEEAIF